MRVDAAWAAQGRSVWFILASRPVQPVASLRPDRAYAPDVLVLERNVSTKRDLGSNVGFGCTIRIVKRKSRMVRLKTLCLWAFAFYDMSGAGHNLVSGWCVVPGAWPGIEVTA